MEDTPEVIVILNALRFSNFKVHADWLKKFNLLDDWSNLKWIHSQPIAKSEAALLKMAPSKKKQEKKRPQVAKPKKQKARVLRALKEREPKLVENVKNLLLIRGNKTNQVMTQLLTDMKMLKAPNVKLFSKKNEIHIFEDETKVEFLTEKNDASCFMVASNTKKRPQNLILGRTFDGHVLDILELGVENYISVSDIKCKSKKAPGAKPCFIFTGNEWETSEYHKKLQNMLVDVFRGQICSSINLKGLDHVISCTASGNRVLFRTFSIDFIKSSNSVPRVQLDCMGPCMDLTFRRSKLASSDLLKSACKKPKGLKEKKVKNITRDELTNDKLGRVHLGRQNLDEMQVRRVKALRKTNKDIKGAAATSPEASEED